MNNPKSLLYSPEVMKVLEHGKNNITNVYKNNSLQFYYQYEYNEYDYPSSRTISYGYKDVYTYENIYSE